jgi:hypothetical protein
MLSLPLYCKDHLYVFNKIQVLFVGLCQRPSFVVNTFQALFTKTGGSRMSTLPKSFDVSYSRYLQCSQQDTNSYALFAAPILCFQRFVDSFAKNTGVGGG